MLIGKQVLERLENEKIDEQAVEVDLRGNMLHSLSLRGCFYLKRICVSGNAITSLSFDVELPCLEYLDASSNLIERVEPGDVRTMQQLRHLDLSNNAITYVPQSIGKLRLLRYLDLSLNMIETIPEQVGELIHLQFLDLSCNRIKRLVGVLEMLIHLERLFLQSNPLEEVDGISDLIALQVLDISDTLLSDPHLSHVMTIVKAHDFAQIP
ncbi:hypothetical protein EDD86DRAFT_60596 [Gorgonomyces haynaldii]|nr:hypothetical protein EDD86DRAFT_60596 [Gorgonomyces haynaldii]